MIQLIQPAELFDFPLDAFQLEAIAHLEQGKSVVVCAPTGSGKTVVAEYAIESALRSNRRCFYTTPLKALSNQKFGDLQLKYGAEKVGLLTGDISINRDAAVVVMTTEVFRNMLYGTILGDVGRNLRNVACVVLDECHYMNDAQRGTVWEESIIYATQDIQLIALSATVANAEDLTAWIHQTHGPTDLVLSDHRPVPLRFHYFGDRHIYPLLNPGGGLNTQLKSRFARKRYASRKPRRFSPVTALSPAPGDVLSVLSSRNMLPAIYFLFSRKGCEDAMKRARGIPLINHDEEVELKRIVGEYVLENPNLAKHPHLPYLYESMSVHHAGMLPSWKALVEKLFQRGLLKVVFATETLAAGINMPARTTVISSLSKRGDEGTRNLTASEFLQMSGRAGRRGMDEQGHVVVLHHPFESVEDAARLSIAPPDPLRSRFAPSYGMVLNLLQRHTIEDARDLIERSFGQFLATLQAKPLLEQKQSYKEELERLRKPLCPDRIGDLNLYAKKLDTVKALHQQIKSMEKGLRHGGRGSGGGDSNISTSTTSRAQAHKDTQTQAHVQSSPQLALQSMRVQIKEILNDAYSMPCHGCPVQKPCSKQTDRVLHLEGRLKSLDRHIQHEAGRYWNTFMALCDILKHEGYLSGSTPTKLGQLAAGIRGTNELFLAEVIVSGVLNNLSAPELAAILCALVSEDSRSQAIRAGVDPNVELALEKIAKTAADLHRLQREFDVDISVGFDSSLAPLAQMWASGSSWYELLNATTYAEGDIVRTFRRTLDLARQFSYAPHVPEQLAATCRIVESLIARDELKQEM